MSCIRESGDSPRKGKFNELRRSQKSWLEAIAQMGIPEGSMRVAPNSDAVVWKINPDHCGEL